jgi:hypothetical protein
VRSQIAIALWSLAEIGGELGEGGVGSIWGANGVGFEADQLPPMPCSQVVMILWGAARLQHGGREEEEIIASILNAVAASDKLAEIEKPGDFLRVAESLERVAAGESKSLAEARLKVGEELLKQ